jgi:hypothetical protein
MKRLLALLFLFVFFFNVGGYYVMYWGLRQQANAELRTQLDAGLYTENQTVTIKVPITIPYQTDHDFERVDGEFEHKGEFYKLVKQQIKSDTLYVVCIKDQREKQLVGELINYTKLANDLPSTSQTLKLFGNLLKDYSPHSGTELTTDTLGYSSFIDFADHLTHLVFSYSAITSPPPRQA